MADINVVVLVGRLGKDAEIKTTPSGSTVANFSIAVNRRVKKNDVWSDEVSYFDVQLWGKMAESLRSYLVKGRQISVEGELRQDRWEQDRVSRSKVYIFAETIQLLAEPKGGKPDYSENGYKPINNQPPMGNEPPKEPTPEDYMDDVIPF